MLGFGCITYSLIIFDDLTMKKAITLLFFFAISLILVSCKEKPKSALVKQAIKNIKTDTAKKDAIKKIVITDPDLKNLVDSINSFLLAYDTLSVFNEYDTKSSKIPKSFLDSANYDNSSQAKGKISGNIPIKYYQAQILNMLGRLIMDKHTVEYKLENLLNTEYISLVHSDDGRLYNLSIDEKTGGSYRSSLSIIHYRAENGKVYNDIPQTDGSDGYTSSFSHDGYGVIHTIKTPKGTKYLLEGSVMGCNTCVGNYIDLLSFKKDVLVSDFSVSLDTREGDGQLFYDEKEKSIYVDYVTDDIHPECDCNLSTNSAESTADNKDFGQKCSCVFKFDGNTFIQQKRKIRSKRKTII